MTSYAMRVLYDGLTRTILAGTLEALPGDRMDEAAWQSATTLDPFWTALEGRASDRKAWLFLCACCYRVKHLQDFSDFIPTVELAERYADGLVTDEECRQVGDLALRYIHPASMQNEVDCYLTEV